MIFLKCKIRFIYVGFNCKRKKWGKKMSGNFAIKGGGVGPLMANAIKNFHFDFLTTSLSNIGVASIKDWNFGSRIYNIHSLTSFFLRVLVSREGAWEHTTGQQTTGLHFLSGLCYVKVSVSGVINSQTFLAFPEVHITVTVRKWTESSLVVHQQNKCSVMSAVRFYYST